MDPMQKCCRRMLVFFFARQQYPAVLVPVVVKVLGGRLSVEKELSV